MCSGEPPQEWLSATQALNSCDVTHNVDKYCVVGRDGAFSHPTCREPFPLQNH